ncbi:hypothetical protein K466DRAFT_57225 [Polyporus arcularius HHB13444]|uniref:Uncharacterized protein n=1 Tax=Polyporus arcularius HHB13444 TaxID=1314778 RepID=A0A5C3NQY2_9APHY|nr:hypothetical protein K466DRAFT_57225 [Polyporus arcularius HHB13444]
MAEASRSVLNRFIPDICLYSDVTPMCTQGNQRKLAVYVFNLSTTGPMHYTKAITPPGVPPTPSTGASEDGPRQRTRWTVEDERAAAWTSPSARHSRSYTQMPSYSPLREMRSLQCWLSAYSRRSTRPPPALSPVVNPTTITPQVLSPRLSCPSLPDKDDGQSIIERRAVAGSSKSNSVRTLATCKIVKDKDTGPHMHDLLMRAAYAEQRTLG